MATRTFEYKDFSGGDWGRLEAWRAPKNTFSGQNVLVYRTGELGVRAGVRLTNPSGLVNGAVWGMGRLPGTPTSTWFGQGTAIRYFTAAEGVGAVSAATGALTGTPGGFGSVAVDETGTTTYIATTGANGYSFNGTAITSLNTMPNAYAIALYGDRLAIVPTASPNTVQFSAAAAFNDWAVSAGHAVSVTVGDVDQISALYAQRGHLAIIKVASSLYTLTGTPGTNESLRPVYRFDGPTAQMASGRTRSDDRIWYAPRYAQHVAAFDGSKADLLDNYPMSLYTAVVNRTVVPLFDDDQAGAAFITPASGGAANEVWLKSRGIWTKHTFGVSLSNYASTAIHGYPQDGDATLSRVRYGTKLVFSDGGGAGAAPNFWTWQPFVDRPGLEASPFSTSAERAGDASSTPVSGSVTLPEQRLEDGSEVQVRGVIVDFRSWNTGGSANNHFDLVVNTLNSYESTAPVSSATASFDETPGASPLAGSVRSKYFSFGDQGRGGAFQLVLTNISGVAFQRFRIVTEVYPARG